MYRLLVSFIFLTGVLGQVARNGTCNFANISSVRDLNVTKLSGDWYQVKRIENSQECGTCSTTRINAIFKNSSLTEVTISNKEVLNKKINYKNGTISLNNEIQGKFFMKFEDITYDAMVLATNYTSYAILYSCKNINNATKNVWSWVLSRNSTLKSNEEVVIESIININEDLRNATWKKPEHSKRACAPNSGVSFNLSPILGLLAVLNIVKEIFAQ